MSALYKVDDVRVLISTGPAYGTDAKGPYVTSDMEVTFVNAGNRSAVVESAELYFTQSITSDVCEKDGSIEERNAVGTTLKNQVLKDKEVAAIIVKLVEKTDFADE